MFVYSVFDKKAKYFSIPFFAKSSPEAIRSFSRLVNDDRTDVFAFPDDFALYCIGEFNFDNGVISGADPVMKLCDAVDVLKPSKTE